MYIREQAFVVSKSLPYFYLDFNISMVQPYQRIGTSGHRLLVGIISQCLWSLYFNLVSVDVVVSSLLLQETPVETPVSVILVSVCLDVEMTSMCSD